MIDLQLVGCGWLAQSKPGMNLGAGPGIAVREFQTASRPVDYGLFVGRTLCGVIEAKAEGAAVSGLNQTSRHPFSVSSSGPAVILQPFDSRPGVAEDCLY